VSFQGRTFMAPLWAYKGGPSWLHCEQKGGPSWLYCEPIRRTFMAPLWASNGEPSWLRCEPSQLSAFHFDAHLDPAFHFDAHLDPLFTLMQIR
jgi:hypothetical protein